MMLDLSVKRQTIIEDCEVCCRPWQVEIERSGGKLKVRVHRAQ